jgi:hypothetical protein
MLAALAGCGGDSPARPPVVIVTPEPVHTVWSQTSFANFQPDIWLSIELLIPAKSILDITVDWTYPDTWMYVYLGKAYCSYDQLTAHTCPFVLASETQTPKPRVLFSNMIEQEATYYLYLYNVPRDRQTGIGSDNTEAVALQLGLTVFPGSARAPGAVTIGRTQVLGPGH